MVEGYQILRSESLSNLAPATDYFTDLTFTDTPSNTARRIQVQLDLTPAVIVEFTLDGTNFRAINNAASIEGLFVFEVYVENDETFNLQSRAAQPNVTGTVKVFG